MLFNTVAFVGVDPTSGRKAFTYAALDAELRLLALDDGEMDDMLAFLGGQASAWVAVNAPSQPNRGLVRDVDIRQSLPPLHHAGRGMDMRLCEHTLRERNISVATTPGKPEMCPAWMQVGFDFYRKLGGLGYQAFPAAEGATHVWLETHPQAVFAALLEQLPLPKPSIEGRLQRQVLLYDRGLGIRDGMEYFEEITRHRLLKGILPLEQIYHPGQLDALAAAYTAWMAAHRPGELSLLGDAQEGQMVLPVKELRAKY